MEKSLDVVFCDPPSRPRGPGRSGRTPAIRAALVGLKEHPGEWARIVGPVPRGTAGYMVTRIRRGVYGTAPGEFHARQGLVDGDVYVWACYQGNGS